jgi:hypothetical protein
MTKGYYNSSEMLGGRLLISMHMTQTSLVLFHLSFLLIWSSFYDAVSNSQLMASNDWMIWNNEAKRIWKEAVARRRSQRTDLE